MCVSYFAADAFSRDECTKALHVFDKVKVPCMAILWRTFGEPGKGTCTSRFLSKFKSKPHVLEVHFSNEAGRRNKRLGEGEFVRTLSVKQFNSSLIRESKYILEKLRRRALSISDYYLKFGNPNTDLILSTGLEDNYTNKAYRVIVREIKKNIHSNIWLVRNPQGSNEANHDYSGADFIELHGMAPAYKTASRGRCIANLDGTDIRFENGGERQYLDGSISMPQLTSFIKRAKKDGCRIFLWWSGPQGIERGKFTYPRSRNFRIFRKDITLVNKIIRHHYAD